MVQACVRMAIMYRGPGLGGGGCEYFLGLNEIGEGGGSFMRGEVGIKS